MAMDTGDFLLDDVGQWLGAFASPTVLIELASLLVCVALAWVVVVPHCLTRVAATQPLVRVCEICRGTVAASQQVWF